MPAPMVPDPSTPTLRTLRGVALAPRLALGEEQVAQRARRLGAPAFLEAAARQRQRRAEGLAAAGQPRTR